jgi:Kdo2-lipid IVA lauroyltransferase/acyltransferase
MNAVAYYLFYGINWILTLLPLRVLYLFSDLLYYILYYIISYRRKVVKENLKNSFPEKSDEERKTIEKKFYRHLSDLIIETFKLTHMSQRSQKKRFTYSNLEIIYKLKEEKRDIIAVLGHYNNWEWPTLLPFYLKYKTIIIYKPLQNKYFNGYMNNNRSKYGIVLTPTSHVIRDIINYKNQGINTLSVFISDQIPAKGDIKYWTTFLNQDTAVFTGAGKIASKYDMAVVFFNVQKLKRGHYNLDIELLHDHTAGLSEEVITETHVRRLEEIIKDNPEYWIWSHRRWKHKKHADNA